MKKLLVVVAIFLGAVTALVWVGVASAIPIVTLADLGSPTCTAAEVEVKDSQVLEIESLAPLRFVVTPRAGGGARIAVESPRTVPENFKVGIDVGLRGSYDPEKNLFRAYRVTTKCPSRYEDSKAQGAASAYGETPPPAGAPPAARAETRS